MIEARDYQTRTIQKSVWFLNQTSDPFRQLWSGPTGCGKSLIELSILQAVPDAWLITPKIEIIAGMLDKLGYDTTDWNEDTLVETAMKHRIGTPIRMSNRWMSGEMPAPDKIILDEAHHDNADTYQNLYAMTLARMVGFTATPFRGTPKETRILWERWGQPKEIISYEAAQNGNYISLPYCCTVPLIDDDIVKVSGNEFEVKSLTQITMPKIADIANLVNRFYDPISQQYSRSTLVAVPSTIVGQELQYLVYGGRFISAETPKKKRLQLIRECEQRRIALIHINTITEGVDAQIRRLIDVSPTMSPVRWAQQLGRITRPTEDAPEYYCCNRNLLRHSYILSGALPLAREAILQAEAAFQGYGKHPSGGRVFGTEGLGRIQGTSIKLVNGLTAVFYCFSCTVDRQVQNFAVIFHPLQQKSLWATRTDKIDGTTRPVSLPNGEVIQVKSKEYGTWEQCEPLKDDVVGFASISNTNDITDRQRNWWGKSAERYGIAELSPSKKQFQILPVLKDIGVVLS